jgi:hypothetical protein
VPISRSRPALYARAARRLLPRGRILADLVFPAEQRLLFVVGCPRSGTTFLARAIGSLPGFVDLGEVSPLKAAIPQLAQLPAVEAAPRLRRILDTTRRLGFVRSLRGVEQTPETAFVLEAAAAAYPRARAVHIVRDGRDVVSSLLERGWLRDHRGGADDAGQPYGGHARFWVEPERKAEFAAASEARRAAWAWRRYVAAAREARAPAVLEVRYERLVADPQGLAGELAAFLDAPVEPLAAALGAAHAASVGRWRRDLSADQLREVEDEAGELLRALGYV